MAQQYNVGFRKSNGQAVEFGGRYSGVSTVTDDGRVVKPGKNTRYYFEKQSAKMHAKAATAPDQGIPPDRLRGPAQRTPRYTLEQYNQLARQFMEFQQQEGIQLDEQPRTYDEQRARDEAEVDSWLNY